MTIAEIKGKISDAGTNLSERMEDLLTSDIFGCLRYVPSEKALLPFLRTAVSFKGKTLDINDQISAVHCTFWPWLTSPGCIPCEPDVVIGLETEGHLIHIIGIEAKYHSDISSEEDERVEPNDQLARELDNFNNTSPAAFKWRSGLVVVSRNLLYVTQDMSMPRDAIAKSLDEFTRKRKIEGDIFWTSWRFLPIILEKGSKNESDDGHRAVMEDMLSLLLRKGLMMFRGIEPCAERLKLADYEFYRHRLISYHWPDICKVSEIPWDYKYQGVTHD
jgi:hypothetical protein